jgi:hypothetical protein
MKKGFAVEIQLDLSEEEKKSALKFVNEFVIGTLKKDMYYSKYMHTRGGYSSYLKRGVFGYRFDEENNLVFRRISRNQRRFAVVKANTLVNKDTKEVFNNKNMNMCMCPLHLGGTKVDWSYMPETYTYVFIGDIKG